MPRKIFKTLIVGSVALFAVATQAASFDCKKAKLLAEQVVCSDRVASKLDEDISALYRNLLPFDGGRLKVEQRAWLSERNACREPGCVRDSLASRWSALLQGADSYVAEGGLWKGIAFQTVAGLREGKIRWLNYVSMNAQGHDCSFELKQKDGLLSTDAGLVVHTVEKGQEMVFPVNATYAANQVEPYPCGLGAVLPKAIHLKGKKLSVEW